ncbi:MAG TPA: UvrD-helicase domain-containing protein, partial [Candidatus Polarisedimenticolaceae bacterium]|nr:UvrD-helicase domain-containing protein [Candidatus Polarisedimenticolaceae bacterium]
SGLNPAQRQAVIHGGGPLLVLAGAGSGKTRVIVHRIAHLILVQGVPADQIVAVTFTNKAASEMRERVQRLLGAGAIGSWIGTFHGLCLRILRRDGHHIGLAPGFNIYDTDDQLALLKQILRERDDTDDLGTPRSMLARISRAKNGMQSADDLAKTAFSPERKRLVEVYREYDAGLRRAQAVDFDDLLLRTLELLRTQADVAERYASRCGQLLVDEYQDTNRPQYLLIRRLSAAHGNVTVVGDEDQSIYRFRGAEIRNILDFERDYPGTCTIRLERNYRSTGTIIEAAGAVIARNVQRKGKALWTENPRGSAIELYRAPDDRIEALWVAQRVRQLESDHALYEMAVLYRTNAQSRQFEEVFRREKIAHQVVGSVRFYERREVKDLLAYLKLAVNASDDVAFTRVVNTPPRGVGATSLATIAGVARARGVPLIRAASVAIDDSLIAPRAAASLRAFLELIDDLSRRAAEDEVAGLVERVVEAVSYEAYLHRVFPGQGRERMENVRALVSATVEYIEEDDRATLHGFLDRLALVSDADEVGSGGGVTLMTIHCAKGLEYPVVLLAGMEENLFPHVMATQDPDDVEEERRLFYVAMTRAKERLLLSHARFRRTQGVQLVARASRFLDELPPELIEESSAPPDDVLDVQAPFAAGDSGPGSSAARVAARLEPRERRAPPVARGADPGDGYPVGAWVQHPRFGAGRILQREGRGTNLKLTIHFADYGPKRIAPSYTQLRVQLD